MIKLTIDEARPILEKILGQPNYDRLDSVSPDRGFLLNQTGREICPDADYVILSILASAGDKPSNVKEKLDQFEEPSREFGKIIGAETAHMSRTTMLKHGGMSYMPLLYLVVLEHAQKHAAVK